MAKERDDASEHGELRRVTSAVLQMFDSWTGRSILIAATNHEGMLDTAVWRRFEEVLFLKPPTAAELRQLPVVQLRGVLPEFGVAEVLELGWFEGKPHLDVERAIRRAVKEMALAGESPRLRLAHLDAARKRDPGRARPSAQGLRRRRTPDRMPA